MNLVAAKVAEFQEKCWVEVHAALGLGIELDHPTANAFGIELGVPGGVERVGEIDAATVAAEFDHLRSAVQVGSGMPWVWCFANDATEMDGAGFFRMERVGDV